MEFQISWSNYLTACFIASTGYYIFVYFRFYKNELFSLKSWTKLPKREKSISSPTHNLAADHSDRQHQDSLMSLVHEMVDELQALLKQLSLQSADKGSIIQSVSKLLKKYSSLNTSNFRESLTNLIAVESENQCKVHLSADELAALWN